MILFCLKLFLADKHGEVAVFDSKRGKLGVQEALDLVPNKVGAGPQDVAARNVIVVDKFGLCDDLGVPLTEVDGLFVLHG